MKLAPIDLQRLAPSLALGLTLALAGLAAGYWGQHQARQAELAQQQARQQLQQLQTRLANAEEENTEIRQKGELYRVLQNRGFFAPENRLEWIELLRQAKIRLGLPLMHYEFTPQHPLEGMESAFFSSSMELQLGLDHEQELEELMKNITTHSKPLVLIRECEISRSPGRPIPPLPGNNLAAHCKLEWISGRTSGS